MMKKYIHSFNLELIYEADFNIVNDCIFLGKKWYNRFDSKLFQNARYSVMEVLFENKDKTIGFEIDWKKLKTTFVDIGDADFSVPFRESYSQISKLDEFIDDFFTIFKPNLDKPFKHLNLRYQVLKEIQTNYNNLKSIISNTFLNSNILRLFDGCVIDTNIVIEKSLSDNEFQLITISAIAKKEHKTMLGKVIDFGTDCQVLMTYSEGINRSNEDLEQKESMFSLSSDQLKEIIQKSYENLNKYYNDFMVQIRNVPR